MNYQPEEVQPARTGPIPTAVDLDITGLKEPPRLRHQPAAKASGLQRWLAPQFLKEGEVVRRARLVLIVSLITAGSTFGLAGSRWLLQGLGSPVGWALFGVAFAAMLGVFALRYGRSLDLASVFAPGAALLAAAVMGGLETGLRSEVAPWLPLMPLVGVLFLGRRGAVGFGTGALVVVLVMSMRSASLGHFSPDERIDSALRVFATFGAVGFSVLLGLVYEQVRVDALTSLALSEGQTSVLLRAMPDLLIVLDAARKVVDSSTPPNLELPPEVELRPGRRLSARMPASLARTFEGKISEAVTESKVVLFEVVFGAGKTRSDYEARAIPVSAGATLLILRDRTEQRAGERLRDDFVSVVSHELRTPLTAIRGALGLLGGLGMADADAQSTRMLTIAERNAERLGDLIDDLLDVQKITSGQMRLHPEVVDVEEFLRLTLELNDGYARRFGANLELARPLFGPSVFSDPERLGQILANLISNACKFSEKGSTVRVGAIEAGDALEFFVADRGSGIPDEFRSRIFQRFSQADGGATRQVGGTGLGLHIVQQLSVRLGGDVRFESEDGAGTTFFVRMPIQDPR